MALKPSAPFLSRLLLGSVVLGMTVLISFSVWMIGIFAELKEPIQEIKLLKSSPMPLASEIFDRNGEKIGELSIERRYFVRSKDLPKWVIDAFLCAEDKTFYKHSGINFKAILRALIKNMQNQGMSQGASTITQQLVRIYFLSNERTLKRKLKEVILAIIVEKNYSKSEILDLYLNRIYLGNRSYGIEAAARNYFRKNAKDLTLAEAAILAGIPKSPTKYAPHRNRSNALKRQYWVLGQMVNKKVISGRKALRARHESLKFYNHAENHWIQAPYFVEAVKKELTRKLELQGLKTSGLKIRTTLDSALQKSIQKSMSTRIKQFNLVRELINDPINNHDLIQGAVVSIDRKTGAVLAMQGGEDFGTSQFNRSIFTRRPLGTLVIPFYVATAIEQGLTPISLIDEDLGTRIARDLKVTDSPQKHRKSLSSLQTPLSLIELILTGQHTHIAQLGANIGQGTIVNKLQSLGLKTQLLESSISRLHPQSATASPLEVAESFTVFRNGGKLQQHYLIESVETSQGQLLYKASPKRRPIPVLTREAALVTEHLTKLPRSHGYASQITLPNHQDIVVEGTSVDLSNSWVVHSNDQIIQVVWIGAEKGGKHLGKTPQIIRQQSIGFMQTLLVGMPAKYRENPLPLASHKGESLGSNWIFVDIKRPGQKDMKIPMLKAYFEDTDRDSLAKSPHKTEKAAPF